MNQRVDVITAATGRIGSRVARGLLEAGHRVRVVGRSGERLESLVQAGAEPHVGDLGDRAFLERALDGADSALLVVRADRRSRDFRRDFAALGACFAEAARTVALPAVTFVSSTGAHDDRHRGLVLVHRDVELILADVSSLAVTNLRAPFFLENLAYFLPAMKARGAAVAPIAPDALIDAASTADIARAALRLLTTTRSHTRIHELRRREPFTMRALSDVLGRALARPFAVERMAREASVDAMVGAGASHDFAHLMNDAWDTFSRYGLLRAADAEWSNAETPIEDFLRAEIIPALGGARP